MLLRLITIIPFFLPVFSHCAQTEGFQLFDHNWYPQFIQKTSTGWQRIYLCNDCQLTPSFTVITSTESVEDSSLFSELDRAYNTVTTEDRVTENLQNFKLIHATNPLSIFSPARVTAVITQYQSIQDRLWYSVRAVIEAENGDEQRIAENLWMEILAQAKVYKHSMILHFEEATAVVDISSPDRTWFSDLVEKTGTGKLISMAAATDKRLLLLLGAQIVLGAAGVRGPCGKPIGQCPCTKFVITNAIKVTTGIDS